jgi:hypothetical protein
VILRRVPVLNIYDCEVIMAYQPPIWSSLENIDAAFAAADAEQAAQTAREVEAAWAEAERTQCPACGRVMHQNGAGYYVCFSPNCTCCEWYDLSADGKLVVVPLPF